MDLRPVKSLAKRVIPYHIIRRASLARTPPEPELRGLSRMAGAGCFVDVGANFGQWSWFAAHHFKRVHAFEPNVKLAALLKKSLPRNVEVHAIALSDHQGQGVLQTPIVDGDQVYALGSLETDANGTVPTTPSSVELRTLDELEIRQIDAIKIDVEGHEAATLSGAQETISRERPVLVVEIEERHHVGQSEAIIERLAAQDYGVYYMRDGLQTYRAGTIGALQELPFLAVGVKNPGYVNNFIFTPSEKRRLSSAFS
jgi:FkbM family methyltransferase